MSEKKGLRTRKEINDEYSGHCAQMTHKLFVIEDLEKQIQEHKEIATRLRQEKPAPEETKEAPPAETI